MSQYLAGSKDKTFSIVSERFSHLFWLLFLNSAAVTEIVYTLLGTQEMLAGSTEYNTPAKFYDFLRGPMSLIYAGDAFSGDDYVTSGAEFFNGLRLLEDISIRQIRFSGRACGRTAQILFSENICFDNSFLLDASKEEKRFAKTSMNWTVPDPLSSLGSSLYNYSRDAWEWSSADTTGESRFLAKYHVYPGSGYKTFLPRNGTTQFIEHLQDNYWIDPKTSAVIVSFVVYSSTLVRKIQSLLTFKLTLSSFYCLMFFSGCIHVVSCSFRVFAFRQSCTISFFVRFVPGPIPFRFFFFLDEHNF